MKLASDFYLRDNVVEISKQLLGKILFSNIGNKICAGMIVETEAYAGVTDRASHAYGCRNTERTKIMFAKGGTAYVYLCYGIHHLFNVVTNNEGVPHAVLVRAIEPFEGIETMLKRRNKNKLDIKLTSGPGKLSEALGIKYTHNGLSLYENKIWIEDVGIKIEPKQIISAKRIGVDYAKEDALLPYRFFIKENKWVSKLK